MKKAVMYGAGNIGRGFIAQLFNLSGYEVTFIDVVDAVVEKLNTDHEYPLYITGENGYEKTLVKNVRAVNGKDLQAVAEEIAAADVMATAVGVNVLKFIAPVIADGIKLRAKRNCKPLNIIICENKIEADKYLCELIGQNLNEEEKNYLTKNIGLVEASIGRMVPATPEEIKAENPLAVCVEKYCTLPVDKAAFKGEIPEVVNMTPFAPFELYIQRKLYMHNMSHAITAYLGYLCGYKYIWEANQDDRIRIIALSALLESAQAISLEHKVSIEFLMEHIFDLLGRFRNKLLGDTIERVGKDTIRKLGVGDRIAGPIKLCEKNGIVPVYIRVGLAAGLLFAPESDTSAIEVKTFTEENGVAAALEKYSGITDKETVESVEKLYHTLKMDGIDGLALKLLDANSFTNLL